MTIQIAPAKNIISLCHPLSRIKLGFGLYYSKFNLYLFFKCPVGTLQIWLRHSHARNIKQGISNDDVLLSAFINRDTFACRFFDKEGERQVTLYRMFTSIEKNKINRDALILLGFSLFW